MHLKKLNTLFCEKVFIKLQHRFAGKRLHQASFPSVRFYYLVKQRNEYYYFIFEKGDAEYGANYRSMTWNSCMCGVFEGTLKRAIISFLSGHNAVARYRHGFLSRRSCLSIFCLVKEMVIRLMNKWTTADVVKLYFAIRLLEKNRPTNQIVTDRKRFFEHLPFGLISFVYFF